MLTQKLSAYALIPRASTPCQFSLKDEAALVRKANGCPRARLACPAPPRANRPLRRTRVGLDSTLHQLCCSPKVRGPVRYDLRDSGRAGRADLRRRMLIEQVRERASRLRQGLDPRQRSCSPL